MIHSEDSFIPLKGFVSFLPSLYPHINATIVSDSPPALKQKASQ